jgi:hypothetical protein
MQDSQGTKQADFKLRDTCGHVEDGEKAALITFAVICLFAWSLMSWWYTTGVDSTDRQARR